MITDAMKARAREVANSLTRAVTGKHDGSTGKEWERLIAQALADADKAATERAAQIVDGWAQGPTTVCTPTIKQIAAAIRRGGQR